MKRLIFVLFILFAIDSTYAQQYSLYNTRTLFDSFENPSQKAFQPDSSRKFAFNFFIPATGFNAALGGPAVKPFRSLLFDDEINASGLVLGRNKTSTAFAHMNTYLLMLRLYRSVYTNKEVGLSWQVRSDNQVMFSNESIAIFDNFDLFGQTSYSNLFNDKGYSQNYHQISLTFRRDYNRQLGMGMKVSYLSGIAYNGLRINSSSLSINSNTDSFNAYIQGKYRTTFLYDQEFEKKSFFPSFKNPGMAVSASLNYHFPKGWYLLANLKDIGFIKWNKNSYLYSLNKNITINNASDDDADDRLADELDLHSDYTQEGFISPTNGKAEVLINKNLGFYQPNLLLSKNLFYRGADIALMNNVTYRNFNLSFSTVYNSSNILQIGSQFMIKSPNTEFYIGSDQFYKGIQEIKAFIRDDESIFKGYPGASFYIGFAAKFGYIIEHPQNANRISHFNTGGRTFIERLLRKAGISF